MTSLIGKNPMKCPHCLQAFYSRRSRQSLGADKDGTWIVTYETCPACEKHIIELKQWQGERLQNQYLAYPRAVSRAPVAEQVPARFADEYREACLVLPDSPRASAALSRRCLQNLLREKAGVKASNLADEIQHVIDSGRLPVHLSDGIDAVRNIAKFAAHPIKSKRTGEITGVEPGEAEWNLDILEGLFDFYFVQPALLKDKRDELNKKLKEAGKPPVK